MSDLTTKAGGVDRLRVLDLFSGIGGFSLGLERAGGFQTVAFCEIEPFCRRVLAKHWPEVPCHDDVRTLHGLQYGPVDVVCGGLPRLARAGRPCHPRLARPRHRRGGMSMGYRIDHLHPDAVGLKLYRHGKHDLIACESVIFKQGRDGVDTVLRRAQIAGRVDVGGTIVDHFADVLTDESGTWSQTIALDAKSYGALKNHWMRCKVDRPAAPRPKEE